MTHDRPTPEKTTNRKNTINNPSRRDFLRTAAIFPTITAVPQLKHMTASTDTETTTNPLVDAAVLPDRFNEYSAEEPVPIATTLKEADSRFTNDDFNIRGFTEGSDPENPRYTIATLSVNLPDRDTRELLSTYLIDEFDAVMTKYKKWFAGAETRQKKDFGDPQTVRLHARIQVPSGVVADVEELDPNGHHQFEEHWGVDANDNQAVMTVVFGSGDSPWLPRTLFTRVSTHVCQHLQ